MPGFARKPIPRYGARTRGKLWQAQKTNRPGFLSRRQRLVVLFLGARGSAPRLSGRGFRIAISGNSPLAAGSFDRDIANIAAN